MTKPREVELKVGRRFTDGIVRLSPYPPALMQLSVSYKGERSASVVLTRQQIQTLREALMQFENVIPETKSEKGSWDERERRQDDSNLNV